MLGIWYSKSLHIKANETNEHATKRYLSHSFTNQVKSSSSDIFCFDVSNVSQLFVNKTNGAETLP